MQTIYTNNICIISIIYNDICIAAYMYIYMYIYIDIIIVRHDEYHCHGDVFKKSRSCIASISLHNLSRQKP